MPTAEAYDLIGRFKVSLKMSYPVTTSAEFIEHIMLQAQTAYTDLVKVTSVFPYVDSALPIPRPYLGNGEIRLVVIGQDPTVQRPESRRRITTVLNLDKNGALKDYLQELCRGLGLSLVENVYATNACKNFFTQPPTAIKEVNVLTASAPIWLPVLMTELDQFPKAAVISLGEPVLSMLVKPEFPQQMRHYWGYHKRWRDGQLTPMGSIGTEQSTIGRTIFPFVHQPTSRGKRAEFYRQKHADYLAFIRAQAQL